MISNAEWTSCNAADARWLCYVRAIACWNSTKIPRVFLYCVPHRSRAPIAGRRKPSASEAAVIEATVRSRRIVVLVLPAR
jgi:hypothetical protein